MKSVIYEFDPVIYPTRLWVCKKPSTEDVAEGLCRAYQNVACWVKELNEEDKNQ